MHERACHDQLLVCTGSLQAKGGNRYMWQIICLLAALERLSEDDKHRVLMYLLRYVTAGSNLLHSGVCWQYVG